MPLMRAWKILLFLTVCFSVAFALAPSIKKNIFNGIRDPQKLESSWTERIKEVGAEKAYEEFAASIENDPPGEQHLSAHIFGLALYKSDDITALVACDDRFVYGCFHEFIGQAIGESGLPIVEKILDICNTALGEKAERCSHSVGHGLLANTGYAESDLIATLGVCSSLSMKDPLHLCYSGTFMEFNLRTMLGEDGSLRSPPRGNMSDPCDRIEQQYKNKCTFWLPLWWMRLLIEERVPVPEMFARMGKWCAAFKNDVSAYYSCLEGIGKETLAIAAPSASLSSTLCDEATTDPRGRFFCKTYAAYRFRFIDSDKWGADSQELCAQFEGSAREYCLTRDGTKSAPLLPDSL